MKAYKDQYFYHGVLKEKIFVLYKCSNLLSKEDLIKFISDEINNIFIKNNLHDYTVGYIDQLLMHDDFANDLKTFVIIFDKSIQDNGNNIEKEFVYEMVDFHGYKYVRTGKHTEREIIDLLE